MKDHSVFGTPAYPLHCSGLAHVLRCPWRSVSKYFFEPPYDASGPAAQTGTATHVAVHKFHEANDAAAGLESMMAGAGAYPLADLEAAAAQFLSYAADPLNRSAKVLLREAKLSFTIKPAPEDPTGQPIVVIGTVDQVREENGVAKVWDLKTSAVDGWNKEAQLLHQHTVQIASYCVGASILLNRKVEPGGLILTKQYAKGKPAFWHCAWSFDDIELIFRGIQHNIAAIRRGDYWHAAGENCSWCHMGSPDQCVPKLQETLQRRV